MQPTLHFRKKLASEIKISGFFRKCIVGCILNSFGLYFAHGPSCRCIDQTALSNYIYLFSYLLSAKILVDALGTFIHVKIFIYTYNCMIYLLPSLQTYLFHLRKSDKIILLVMSPETSLSDLTGSNKFLITNKCPYLRRNCLQ
jgi:uncharacterized membrane protein YcgQ (UPF0703/DUF1980 family)